MKWLEVVRPDILDIGGAILQRFSERVIAPWLAGKFLKTKGALRLALDSRIGINWDNTLGH